MTSIDEDFSVSVQRLHAHLLETARKQIAERGRDAYVIEWAETMLAQNPRAA